MFKLCVSLAALVAVAVADPSIISPSVLPPAYSAGHWPAAYPYSYPTAGYHGYIPSAAYPAAAPYAAPFHAHVSSNPAIHGVPALSPYNYPGYNYPAYNSPLVWKKK